MKINWLKLGSILTFTLTVLAAIPYQLGDVSLVIPPHLKAWMLTIGLSANIILNAIRSVEKT